MQFLFSQPESSASRAWLIASLSIAIALACGPIELVTGQGSKSPIPGKSERDKALKVLKELYAIQYADRSVTGKAKLGRALLALGNENEKDINAQYAVLSEALRISKSADDFETAWRSIGLASRKFEFDGTAARVELLELAGKKIKNPADAVSMTLLARNFTKGAVVKDDYESAEKIVLGLISLARKTKNKDLARQLNESHKEIEKLSENFKKVQANLKTLETQPNDEAANQAIGVFYFFRKGQFTKAIPFLAKGNDPALKPIAELELAKDATTEQQIAIADRWWETGSNQENINKARDRAVQIYRKVLPSLSGLTRKKIESRVTQHDPAGAMLTQIMKKKWSVRWKDKQPPWGVVRFDKSGNVLFTTKKRTFKSPYTKTDGGIRMNGKSGEFYYVFTLNGNNLKVAKFDAHTSAVVTTGIGTPRK